MPKGQLTCGQGNGCLPGSKLVLSVTSTALGGRRVGWICECCARDDYSLRAFLIAAGWLYGWRNLRFNYWGAGKVGPLHLALMGAIDEESSRADEARHERLRRRIDWAVGGPAGVRS